jgi:hypothetical protein
LNWKAARILCPFGPPEERCTGILARMFDWKPKLPCEECGGRDVDILSAVAVDD